MEFCDDSFLLSNPVAADLFRDVASVQPIIDYHCHLSPRDIAEDRRFENLHAVWLAEDHYKWRALRANGVPENLITGKASSDREKFQAWAKTVPATLRNPIFHWTHLELRRHFGIEDLLEEATAQKIWDEANRQLTHGRLTARGILAAMNVAIVGTTDDPADSLQWHQFMARSPVQGAGKSVAALRVVPTFRPDAALQVGTPLHVQAWSRRLSAVAGIGADTFAGLVAALEKRHDDFAALGCRASDHSTAALPDTTCTDEQACLIWEGSMAGTAATAAQVEQFAGWLLLHIARLNHAKGWAMQLHLGPIRNPNPLLASQLGAHAGCDTIGDARQGPGLVHFLSTLAAENSLPRTILYNINPADNALFAAVAGSFQDGTIPGKIQAGAAWWFMDQERGMRAHINTLSDLGLLARFVGMVTDSRSFLSYPRHEYFRRILCDLVGADVSSGRLPSRRDWLEGLIASVCYANARDYFDF